MLDDWLLHGHDFSSVWRNINIKALIFSGFHILHVVKLRQQNPSGKGQVKAVVSIISTFVLFC